MGRSHLPPETIAYRRTLAAGLAAFVGGFIVVVVLLVLAVVHYGPPSPWWAAIHIVIFGVMAPFLGGGAAAVAVMNALDRWHHWRGVFKCIYCERPLRYGHKPCVCWSEPGHPMADIYAKLQQQHRPPRLRHLRKRLKPVLATYAALIPVALLFVKIAPQPRKHPFAVDVIEGHFVLCAFVAVVIAGLTSTLEVFHVGRRFRLRAEAFTRVLALWPLLAGFAAACIAFFKR